MEKRADAMEWMVKDKRMTEMEGLCEERFGGSGRGVENESE